MKKLLFIACAIFALAACEKHQTQTPPEELYILTSEPLPGSNFQAFSDTEMRFSLVGAADGTNTLKMDYVKFVEQMPRLGIEVPGIELSGDKFSIDTIVPTYNGIPMDAYTMSDLKIEVDRRKMTLEVEFECFTMHVKYRGTLAVE